MNSKLQPDESRENNTEDQVDQTGNLAGSNDQDTTEQDKHKRFKVLNDDGSLPDLPDQHVKGTGALDGTVGLGT